MEKGELLGKGTTADVYKWGQDKVIKLYLESFREEWIRREAIISRKVHEAGAPSPEVFDLVEVDGHKGIVFERVFGKTIINSLETEPWMLFNFAQQMAGLHYRIHSYSTDGIPSQKERFEYTISLSAEILGDKVKKILDYVDKLPDGNSICHGDLHFNNVIVSGNEMTAIDWNSCYKGDPSGDVARTYLIFTSPGIPPGYSDIVAAMSIYPKWLACWFYMNEYLKISKVRFENIDAWILPVAAAKLKDKIPGEEEWLMEIINMRLKLLETER